MSKTCDCLTNPILDIEGLVLSPNRVATVSIQAIETAPFSPSEIGSRPMSNGAVDEGLTTTKMEQVAQQLSPNIARTTRAYNFEFESNPFSSLGSGLLLLLFSIVYFLY